MKTALLLSASISLLSFSAIAQESLPETFRAFQFRPTVAARMDAAVSFLVDRLNTAAQAEYERGVERSQRYCTPEEVARRISMSVNHRDWLETMCSEYAQMTVPVPVPATIESLPESVQERVVTLEPFVLAAAQCVAGGSINPPHSAASAFFSCSGAPAEALYVATREFHRRANNEAFQRFQLDRDWMVLSEPHSFGPTRYRDEYFPPRRPMPAGSVEQILENRADPHDPWHILSMATGLIRVSCRLNQPAHADEAPVRFCEVGLARDVIP